MSTQLKSSSPEIILTRFSGGEDRGTCLQISMENDFRATISIRRDQAARLAADLLTFANNQEEQDTTDWKQELRDFINDKSKKYDMPRDKHGYANLMAQLAANNEIDRKRLDALIARTTEEIRTREEQDNG